MHYLDAIIAVNLSDDLKDQWILRDSITIIFIVVVTVIAKDLLKKKAPSGAQFGTCPLIVT
jgi:hypothetical protein